SDKYPFWYFPTMSLSSPEPTSFPPRRSSDLHTLRKYDIKFLLLCMFEPILLNLPPCSSKITQKLDKLFIFDELRKKELVLTPERSEEHTSELKSRENLVCGLLLEKKKARIAH